jgi:MFS transporter, ACS family, solute carrier family 17 (sodium-dependent inorganic phosphate cotransporter), member 5
MGMKHMLAKKKLIANFYFSQAPPSERGTIGTYCYCGAQFGTVVMLGISGILASSSMGWPSIFYISGVAGIVWSILWFYYGSSSPSDCNNRISSEERQFIESSLNTSEEAKVFYRTHDEF